MMQSLAFALPLSLPRLFATSPGICVNHPALRRCFASGSTPSRPPSHPFPPASTSSSSSPLNHDQEDHHVKQSTAPVPSSPHFELLSQDVIFKRYQTVYKREVRYPDGRVISFDVLGNEKSDFQSVFIFPFDTVSHTATLIREYSPGRNAEQLSLVAGMYEPDKHDSLEQAARAELSEEARLTGGELIPLMPLSGFAADKYSLNTFYFFLAINCVSDPNPPPRDEEEWIYIEQNYSLSRVRQSIAQGLFNVPHSLCATLAMDKLRDMGYQE